MCFVSMDKNNAVAALGGLSYCKSQYSMFKVRTKFEGHLIMLVLPAVTRLIYADKAIPELLKYIFRFPLSGQLPVLLLAYMPWLF